MAAYSVQELRKVPASVQEAVVAESSVQESMKVPRLQGSLWSGLRSLWSPSRLQGSLWKVPMVADSVQESKRVPRLRGSLWKVPMVAVTSVQEAMVLGSVQEEGKVPGSAQEAEMAVSRQEAGLPPGLLGRL